MITINVCNILLDILRGVFISLAVYYIVEFIKSLKK